MRASPEERLDDALAKVNATDAQKKTAHDAFDDITSKMAVSRADRAVLKGRLVEQLKSDKPDEAVVEENAAGMVSSGLGVAHAFVDDFAKVHDALNKDQRAKLADEIKPGAPMRAGFFVAGRMGYGPPANAAEAKERAQKHVDKALDKLGVNAQQKEQLEKLALGLVDEASPLLEDKDLVKNTVIAAWQSDKVNVKELHALVDVEGQKIDAIARDAAKRAVEAHAILTPEQRAKVIGRAL
jgi:Spy/CpxP family protein refolding chaperone